MTSLVRRAGKTVASIAVGAALLGSAEGGAAESGRGPLEKSADALGLEKELRPAGRSVTVRITPDMKDAPLPGSTSTFYSAKVTRTFGKGKCYAVVAIAPKGIQLSSYAGHD